MLNQEPINNKYQIRLSQAEQEYLTDIITKGKHSSRVITRARILLLSHNGHTDKAIWNSLQCSRFTVKEVRKRYYQREGIKACITDDPRPGQPVKIKEIHKAFVVAKSCTPKPADHAHWTAKCLRKELLEAYTELRDISDESIRQILVNREIQPWREKNVVHSKPHATVQGADGGYSNPVYHTVT
jgi:transposase